MAQKKKIAITENAPAVLTFARLALIILAVNYFTKGKSNALLFSVYRSPISVFWVIRLFGHVLGHASISHFVGNMTLFLLLGPILEEKYGSWRLVLMMALVAVVSGLVNIIFFPGTALLGASGIVFMMIILVSALDMRKGEIPHTMILVMVIYLGSEVVNMVTVHDNISHLTHLIGGLIGAVLGAVFAARQSSFRHN